MNWRPDASMAMLRMRATWLKQIRVFFEERGVLEVETPILAPATVTDPQIESLAVHFRHRDYYLQTSPEYHMKRLLAADSGPIYQISRVFRADGPGRLHHPEFSLLEWYRPGFDQYGLMQEITDLLARLCTAHPAVADIETISYQDLFARYTDIDPLREDKTALLSWCDMTGHECPIDMTDSWNTALDWVLSIVIQPQMEGLSFIQDYPADQAALARLNPQDPRTARRFELYADGIEIANGFEELTDADEQYRRFEQENRRRCLHGQKSIALDEPFLMALEHGIPETTGVALGLDRLLMWESGMNSIRETMAFGWQAGQ